MVLRIRRASGDILQRLVLRIRSVLPLFRFPAVPLSRDWRVRVRVRVRGFGPNPSHPYSYTYSYTRISLFVFAAERLALRFSKAARGLWKYVSSRMLGSLLVQLFQGLKSLLSFWRKVLDVLGSQDSVTLECCEFYEEI